MALWHLSCTYLAHHELESGIGIITIIIIIDVIIVLLLISVFILMLQDRAARVHTSDHHGHDGQRSVPVGQWPHPGAMAGTQHTSTLSQTGTQRSSRAMTT